MYRRNCYPSFVDVESAMARVFCRICDVSLSVSDCSEMHFIVAPLEVIPSGVWSLFHVLSVNPDGQVTGKIPKSLRFLRVRSIRTS